MIQGRSILATSCGFLTLCLALALGGCAPVQKIYNKEVKTEKESNRESKAAVRPGMREDRYTIGRASADVDFLFVIDNSQNTGHRNPGLDDSALDYFKMGYDRFFNQRLDGPGRINDPELGFRVQLVTTPTGTSPKNFVSSSKADSTALHWGEIFYEGREGYVPNPYLFALSNGDREADRIKRPIRSTGIGLLDTAFKGARPSGRTHIPLFIVYLLGSDSGDANDEPTESPEALATVFKDNNRDLFQTRIMIISNTAKDNTQPGHCDRYLHPTSVMEKLERLVLPADHYNVASQPLSILTKKNLCDAGWRTFDEDLYTDAIHFKRRYVLSERPFDPERMTVNSPSRFYRYGQDYIYNSQTNEITFNPGFGPQDGVQFTVAYELDPTEAVLPGGNGPPPAARTRR